MKTYEISSINDLNNLIQKLGEPKQGTTRFFRGQANKKWDMNPSIFREQYLIENEDKIIKDVLTNCPDDFLPTDTLFEKLVKLQHYGCKTRLLDLTTNALVALYFACNEKKHHRINGELIILDIPNDQIKYFDSDTVAILTAISVQPMNFEIKKSIDAANAQKNLKGSSYILNNYENIVNFDSFKETMAQFGLEIMDKEEYTSLIISQSIEEGKDGFKKEFNEQREIVKLIHDVRADKPSFRPEIECSDLERVLCVRAKLNNTRISRQQGCFLLYGLDKNKLQPAKVPEEWQQKIDGKKIIVKNKAKIMEELKSFGISTQTLFPELEKQTIEIMERYKS
jgi:hypothetical protein